MEINLFYGLILLILLNIRTFVLMYRDKQTAINNQSKNGNGRVPEVTLLMNALLAGFIGIYAGMLLLRHKTRKAYFKLGVPFLGLINVLLYSLGKEELEEDHGINFVFDTSILGDIGAYMQ